MIYKKRNYDDTIVSVTLKGRLWFNKNICFTKYTVKVIYRWLFGQDNQCITFLFQDLVMAIFH